MYLGSSCLYMKAPSFEKPDMDFRIFGRNEHRQLFHFRYFTFTPNISTTTCTLFIFAVNLYAWYLILDLLRRFHVAYTEQAQHWTASTGNQNCWKRKLEKAFPPIGDWLTQPCQALETSYSPMEYSNESRFFENAKNKEIPMEYSGARIEPLI